MTRIDLLRDILVEIQKEQGSPEEKFKSLGPLLFMCNQELSERDFLHWLAILGIDISDKDTEEMARDYLNLFHFSGLVRITVQEEYSWLDEGNINSFRGIIDMEYVDMLEKLKIDTESLAGVLDSLDS